MVIVTRWSRMQNYGQLLKHFLKKHFIFQNDNAPARRSNFTLEWKENSWYDHASIAPTWIQYKMHSKELNWSYKVIMTRVKFNLSWPLQTARFRRSLLIGYIQSLCFHSTLTACTNSWKRIYYKVLITCSLLCRKSWFLLFNSTLYYVCYWHVAC